MTHRIELEQASVDGLVLESDDNKPDLIRLRGDMPMSGGREYYRWTYEIPTQVLALEDIVLLSRLEGESVRIVLEVEE